MGTEPTCAHCGCMLGRCGALVAGVCEAEKPSESQGTSEAENVTRQMAPRKYAKGDVTAWHWGGLFWNLVARLWWHARGRQRLFECANCAALRKCPHVEVAP